jgi:hypothetical protein
VHSLIRTMPSAELRQKVDVASLRESALPKPVRTSTFGVCLCACVDVLVQKAIAATTIAELFPTDSNATALFRKYMSELKETDATA